MIIFDLDDTLYQNKRLSQRNTELTKNWIKEELNLSRGELEDLYQKLPDKYPNPLKGIKSLGLSTQGYYKNVFKKINPEKYLSERSDLKKELEKLDGEKVVVSFAPKNYCSRVLEVLGIEQHFEEVYSASEFESSKRRAYREIKNPDIVVGDNYSTDLKPAADLGIDIIHVSECCSIDQEHFCCKDIVETIRFIRQK